MKLPRDISASALIEQLSKLGYNVTRQKGSHIRLSYQDKDKNHHITIPNHRPIKIGTLARILSDVAKNLDMSRIELLDKIAN